jgi:predicted enzyme related to lactoylglutathione lyase
VKENGGFIVEEPFEISPGTKICLFNEPSGVTLAMLEKVG